MRKATLSIVLICSCTLNLYAQQSRTFKIEELSPPKTPVLAAVSYQEILEQLIREDRKLPGEYTQKELNGEANIIAKSDIPVKLVNRGFHPFFEGMYAAYADHHPFTLSPDMIWLLISQGFANHVNNNAERLRSKFVKFERKETLRYNAGSNFKNTEAEWGKVFAGLGNQIADYIGPELTKTVTANFSTTTATTRIASQITLMNAMSAYFNYEMLIRSCGIPQITLEGTTADWQQVLAKTEALRQYEMDWWVDELVPVLKQFIQASKGDIDKKFWLNMFQHHAERVGCGPNQDLVDGWVVKFFPYDKKGNRMALKTLNLKALMPNEMLKVDLLHKDITDPQNVIETPLELWAGFVGLEQDSTTYGLKPRIGWMVRKKDPYRQALVDRLATDNRGARGVKLRVDNIPPELYKIGPVNELTINFFGNIRIPDAMADMKISQMTLNGTTTKPEVDRIVKLFPKTRLHINGKTYNGTNN